MPIQDGLFMTGLAFVTGFCLAIVLFKETHNRKRDFQELMDYVDTIETPLKEDTEFKRGWIKAIEFVRKVGVLKYD